MTKGKIIFACVGCLAAGFVSGWAARALVKKKNEDLMEEQESEKQCTYIHTHTEN